MSNEFKREERYIVVKIKDAQAIDSNDQFNGYDALRDFLKQWCIPTREAVVVEKGWPEYEPTWAAIERRTSGAVQWNGEGLPPVGTVCEYKRVHEWQKVEVFAVKPNYNGSQTVLVTYENGCWAGCAEPSSFRPVRTPEQIAAEDRDKAIAEMVETARKATGFGQNRADYAALYDAGYRKQVAP